jgi:hypothetical protein
MPNRDHSWGEDAPGHDVFRQCRACGLVRLGDLYLDAGGNSGTREQATCCPTRFAKTKVRVPRPGARGPERAASGMMRRGADEAKARRVPAEA